MHRTLMAKARTMQIYAGCPPELWDELHVTANTSSGQDDHLFSPRYCTMAGIPNIMDVNPIILTCAKLGVKHSL